MKAVLAAVLIGYGISMILEAGKLLAVEENEEKRPASPGMDD